MSYDNQSSYLRFILLTPNIGNLERVKIRLTETFESYNVDCEAYLPLVLKQSVISSPIPWKVKGGKSKGNIIYEINCF